MMFFWNFIFLMVLTTTNSLFSTLVLAFWAITVALGDNLIYQQFQWSFVLRVLLIWGKLRKREGIPERKLLLLNLGFYFEMLIEVLSGEWWIIIF